MGREPCLSDVLTTEPLGPLAGEQEASYKFLSSIARLEPGQILTSGQGWTNVKFNLLTFIMIMKAFKAFEPSQVSVQC